MFTLVLPGCFVYHHQFSQYFWIFFSKKHGHLTAHAVANEVKFRYFQIFDQLMQIFDHGIVVENRVMGDRP